MWDWKAYFNSGMLYGRVFNLLYVIRDNFDDSAKVC